MATDWAPPSPGVALILRDAAQRILDEPEALFREIDPAVFAATIDAMREEPALAAEALASTRSNVEHWATCTARDPGTRVPVNLTKEILDVARDAVRRGAEQILITTYHAGQNVAWRYAMNTLFGMSEDPKVLHEALDITARSMFTYVDDTLAALQERIEEERAQLTRGTHAERLEVVNLILEGAPISAERASTRLGYDLSRRHTAAILWMDPATADQAELNRAAEALARAAGADRPLTVIASQSAVWVWFVTADDVTTATAAEALTATPRVRAAVGPSVTGVDGFRTSHLDALATQRLVASRPSDLRAATYADVRLITLIADNEERATTFASRTLGDLATADPALRETVRVYIREQFSASGAARALFTHRNTVLNRLQKAERLLPTPLERNGLEIGVALEIVQWL